MARMHGEHKNEYAARQLARAMTTSTAEAVPSGRVEVLMACGCRAHAAPHVHSFEARRTAVMRWNRESKHKIAIPKV